MLYPQANENRPLPPTKEALLCDSYHRWFDVVPANTPELREQAYRLRYQVYCREHQYETPDEHPQQMETDEFDSRAIHSLVLDRASGAAMGTVRLILPTHQEEACLPIQRVCNCHLPENFCMSTAAEISRFAVSKEMRRAASGDCPAELKCAVVLGLMKAIVQMSYEYGIEDWLAVMEPSLLRLLHRFGVHFTPIAPLVEYHGMRQPCRANIATLLDTVQEEHYDLWEFVTESGRFEATKELTASCSV
ncbi:MAG: PEP-CTERM/exosortase system-associated acyltransferase [Acidobacteriota bacterium]|nr:PEP-CTERM/exosortase system-associated acyltransferase [Acidobacteriota bacterium]